MDGSVFLMVNGHLLRLLHCFLGASEAALCGYCLHYTGFCGVSSFFSMLHFPPNKRRLLYRRSIGALLDGCLMVA